MVNFVLYWIISFFNYILRVTYCEIESTCSRSVIQEDVSIKICLSCIVIEELNSQWSAVYQSVFCDQIIDVPVLVNLRRAKVVILIIERTWVDNCESSCWAGVD